MQTTAKIDHDKQLTTYIVTGELNWTKIKSVIQDQLPGYLPLNTLWDLRESTVPDVSISELEGIVILMKQIKSREGGRTAVVPPVNTKDSMLKRFENLIQTNKDELPMQIQLFQSMNGALKWIKQDK